MQRAISFSLNDKPVQVTADDGRMLLPVLRYEFGLTGVKFGCGEGLCGACTVIVNDEAVRSCAIPVREISGKRVLTIEGLGREEQLHPIQQAFLKHQAFQCGFCTPGMILSTYALLRKCPQPTTAQIIEHMDGNLCRCGSHVSIIAAIQEAAMVMRGAQ